MSVDLNILIGGAAGQGVHSITLPLAKALMRQGCWVLAESGGGTCSIRCACRTIGSSPPGRGWTSSSP
ncbi:MAG: hypothetical protein HY790_03315 [Deltaproteobacteria bacterium]|nr:hypothetical protein [Deltaproteobacteria bacterium]